MIKTLTFLSHDKDPHPLPSCNPIDLDHRCKTGDPWESVNGLPAVCFSQYSPASPLSMQPKTKGPIARSIPASLALAHWSCKRLAEPCETEIPLISCGTRKQKWPDLKKNHPHCFFAKWEWFTVFKYMKELGDLCNQTSLNSFCSALLPVVGLGTAS